MTRCECPGKRGCGADHGIGTCKRDYGLKDIEGAELGTLKLCQQCREGSARKQKKRRVHESPRMVAEKVDDLPLFSRGGK